MSQVSIYELAVLYYAQPEADLKKVSQPVKKLVEAEGGRVIKEDVWGQRKLAYAIKKQDQAVYVFYDLEIKGEAIAKLAASFNINQDILRYQFYKPDLKALAAALANPSARLTPLKTAEGNSSNQEAEEDES